METNYAYSTKAGTAGGTLLILILKINFSELLTTSLYAAVGAAVSFIVSIIMKHVIKWVRKCLKRLTGKNNQT
jgi:hypothetical protein